MSQEDLAVFCADGGRGRLIPSCIRCAHFNGSREKPACPAFPEGVPVPIWEGRISHLEAYEGDHGIRFKYVPGPDVPAFLRK